MVGGSTRTPFVQEYVINKFGKDIVHTDNPDEAVAAGAAIQGAILKGNISNVVLIDVIPLTVGIETKGGIMAPLIKRNSNIPFKVSETFTTAVNGQTDVEIAVYQGESPLTTQNEKLGSFKLSGIASAPAGIPQIEVTFDIDANGMLNVSAKDKQSNVNNSIKIDNAGSKNSFRLSEEELKQKIEEFEKRKEEDAKIKEKIVLINQLDTHMITLEDQLNGNKDKLDENKVKEINSKLQEARQIKDFEQDIDVIKNKIKELQTLSMEIGKIIYEQEQKTQKNTTDESTTSQDD